MDRWSCWVQHLQWVALSVLFSANLVSAQQLEPRLFSNAPVGLNALAVGYTRSGGNLLLVPSLPLEDVDGDLNLAALSYLRMVDLFWPLRKAHGNPSLRLGRIQRELSGGVSYPKSRRMGRPSFSLRRQFNRRSSAGRQGVRKLPAGDDRGRRSHDFSAPR
jgi:hypothetical protein